MGACVVWLKKANTVVYMCFRCMAKFSSAQFKEIAISLNSVGHDYVERRNGLWRRGAVLQ